MSRAKKDLFDPEFQQLAALCKALSHPARLSIIHFLAEQKVCMTGNIADQLPLGRTTVNQHLAELKKAGLILGEIEGAKTNYCLNGNTIDEFKDLTSKLLTHIETCC